MTRRHQISCAAGSLLLLLGALPRASFGQSVGLEAWSQESTYLSRGAVTKATAGQETGLRLGESAMLHLGVGAEGGYDSNVFYNDDEQISSPILRVTPFLQITNASRDGSIPSGAYYDLSAHLQYREYLTDDENAKEQRAFNPTVNALLRLSNGRAFSFQIYDQYVRLDDPPYTPTDQSIIRDYNIGQAALSFAPGGGRIQASLRYTNTLDYFENEDLRGSSTLTHDGALDLSWLWLPKTSLFVLVGGGRVSYLEQMASTPRSDSSPIRALAGLRGLVTAKLAAHVGVGYATAFYDEDAALEPSGASNIAGLLELQYKPTFTTNVLAGYRHEFRNSPVVGDYLDVDLAYFGVRINVATRVDLSAIARYEFRRFRGMDLERDDNYLLANAGLDYYIQRWLYAGVGYSATVNRSEVKLGDPTLELDYTKHQVIGRLGFVY